MAKPFIIEAVGQVVTGILVLHVLSCASSDIRSGSRAPSDKPTKVDHALIVLQDEFVKFLEMNQDPGQFVTQNRQLRIVDGQVLIDAVAKATVAELVSDLTALGATHISSYGQFVSCFFPIEKLHLLITVDELQFAQPVYATTRPGQSIRQ